MRISLTTSLFTLSSGFARMDTDSGGYVTDVAYLHGYYPSMAPAAIRYAASLYGGCSKPLGHGHAFLELGCGFGETLLTLAASNPDVHFTGVDFLPEHIDHIQQVASAAGLDNVSAHCCDFAEFRSSLLSYDVITLHGVWSWVSPELRKTILKLISRHLADDGLVQVSYNSMPGWSSLLPVRGLMRHFANTASGDSVAKAKAAFAKITAMRKADTSLFRDHPLAAELVDNLRQHDPRYIAHEYLNEHWAAFNAAEVMQSFADAGLHYRARLPFSRNHWQLMADAEFAEDFSDANAATLETRKDYHANTMFRWDIYAKQPRQVFSNAQRAKDTRDLFFRAATNASLPHVVRIGHKEVGIAGPPHDRLLEVMGDRSWTLASLLEHPQLSAFSPEQITEAVDYAVALSLFRVEGGPVSVHSQQDAANTQGEIRGGDLTVPMLYNRHLLSAVVPQGKTVALASTCLRQGHAIGDLHALMLHDLTSNGCHGLEVRVAGRLEKMGKHLTHHQTGRTVTEEADVVAALAEIAQPFFADVVPELLRTGILERGQSRDIR
jgi:SAM-dependent methyltransferase